MTDPTKLLEPSFEVVISAIEQAIDMPAERRRHLVCSVQQIAKWLDRPTALTLPLLPAPRCRSCRPQLRGVRRASPRSVIDHRPVRIR